MATFYVEEYAAVQREHFGVLMPVPGPLLAVQKIAVGATTTTVGNAFNANTKFIYISTDTSAQYDIAAAPAAVAGSRFLVANDSRFLGGPLAGNKIAVIQQQ